MSSGPTNFLFAAAAFALALHSHAPAAQAADVIEVNLDQAKIINLPEATLTLIIGNPVIVDVSMLRTTGKMVLTGKGFGETNLLAVDKNGAVISESTVKVTAGAGNLIIQRGMERESYHCSPRCQPTVALGDTARHMGDTIGQINTRNAAEAGAAAGRR